MKYKSKFTQIITDKSILRFEDGIYETNDPAEIKLLSKYPGVSPIKGADAGSGKANENNKEGK